MPHRDLAALLARSAATDEFKADVAAFASTGRAPRVAVLGYAPTVKVTRLLTQLAHAEPALAVDRVEIEAHAGCADFVGTITVHTSSGETRAFDFVWDCAWRAQEEGYTDCFGFADQIRAAREFGWRCFQDWSPRVPAAGRETVAAR